ncbi:ATP-grasp domain-containing protein [Flavisolibacter ginsenosidimutans]|uniref:ATP-grasp domain-containing protein n=1 Tax=Flavisolibacter ginsenosidimutans TaxID=661481 RepID=A0A5B8UDX5_9BACT|nr:ATP-grasp domain-containing protein [Flavisolibacter ginsenosidimutans]QEC54891.1 ATP-grasp domain-containing protein [Flavisolibacter ginsenosidimutans]
MDRLNFSSTEKIRVLMTGAGAPGGPGIIKALKQGPIDLFTGDCNPVASGRFLSEKFVELPKADSEDFIPFVLNFCLQNKVQVVFPLVTRELFKFAEQKNAFLQNNIKVIVSDYESLSIANDKGKLYTHLYQHSIPVPAFKIVSSFTAFEQAVIELGYPEKAICIKPTVSNGSRGVRILQEEIDEFDLLFNHKPNNLYSTFDRIKTVLKSKAFPELLVSEYLPGEEFTVDTIVQNGEPKLILPRVRTKMNGGISVQGTFINHSEIITYCADIIRSLNLSGPIGLQVKEDANKKFRLLEINPRIQGTSVAALGMGVNLPLLAVLQEFYPVDFDKLSIQWGRSFVRYYEELFY